jgi:hypothetical protein
VLLPQPGSLSTNTSNSSQAFRRFVDLTGSRISTFTLPGARCFTECTSHVTDSYLLSAFSSKLVISHFTERKMRSTGR